MQKLFLLALSRSVRAGILYSDDRAMGSELKNILFLDEIRFICKMLWSELNE